MNPHIYGQLIFNKGTKTIQWEMDSLFNKPGREKWIATPKTMKLSPYLAPYTKQLKMDQRSKGHCQNYKILRGKQRGKSVLMLALTMIS